MFIVKVTTVQIKMAQFHQYQDNNRRIYKEYWQLS
jgi:hypothetical protein